MEATMTLEEAVLRLERWIARAPDEASGQKAAIEHYGRYFAPDNIDKITEEGFKDFLLLKNNRHWTGIHRHPDIYADMKRLKSCLKLLLDESIPIGERLDQIIPPSGPPYIKGLSRAVLTPILMCVYPTKYAVYNRISEEGLTLLGRNPIKKSDPFSKRYVALTRECQEISGEIGKPLTLVDSMFSFMVHGETSSPMATNSSRAMPPPDFNGTGDVTGGDASLLFAMEKHLQEFLVANWEKTPLGKTLRLHSEDEEEATEYPTTVGRIDILARDKKTHDWVVVELKRGRDSDKVLGQLLRYMGWVKIHKAQGKEKVIGIIITSETDERLKYAMAMSQGVSMYTYKVNFELRPEHAHSHGG